MCNAITIACVMRLNSFTCTCVTWKKLQLLLCVVVDLIRPIRRVSGILMTQIQSGLSVSQPCSALTRFQNERMNTSISLYWRKTWRIIAAAEAACSSPVACYTDRHLVHRAMTPTHLPILGTHTTNHLQQSLIGDSKIQYIQVLVAWTRTAKIAINVARSTRVKRIWQSMWQVNSKLPCTSVSK